MGINIAYFWMDMKFRLAIPRLALMPSRCPVSLLLRTTRKVAVWRVAVGLLAAWFVPNVFAQASTNIPIFQLAAFFNPDLDFSPGQTITFNGKVHCNGTIWMCPQANAYFNDIVEAVVVVTNRDNPNDQQNLTYIASYVHYSLPGQPVSRVAPLLLSTANANINPTNSESILNLPPPALGAPNSAAYAPSNQIYLYNACDLIISNSIRGTNGVLGTNLTIYYQDFSQGGGPLIQLTNNEVCTFSNRSTHLLYTTNSPIPPPGTNYTLLASSFPFVTNVTFYDFREAKTVQAVQLDVAKLGNWLTNAAYEGSIWNQQCFINKGHRINSIYVYISVPMTSTQLPAVRLVNGQQLTSSNGLTIATPMPLYVLGNYNIQTNNGGSQSVSTTNTAWTWPAALMGDAITILSSNWNDAGSAYTNAGSYTLRLAVNTTVNAAFLAGIVSSTNVAGTKHYSGGLENFLRLEENWSGDTLTFNGSIAVLFTSIYATNFFIQPGTYYGIPTRNWGFDANFKNPAKLPPLTPQILGTNTATKPPIIGVQPHSLTVPSGTTATFYVIATNTPLSYQWNFNGTNLDGATNPLLTLTNVQFDQAGNYAVLVSNPGGATLSSNASLTVLALPPTIWTQPTNQTVLVNSTATFNVAVTGSLPLSYQWSLNGVDLDGATNALLTLNNVQTNQAGNYAVLVTNLFGATNSANAVLTVVGLPPTIQKQPTNQTVFINGTATFSVSATGSSPLSYQWSFNGTNLDGATNASLTLTDVQLDQNGNYSVQVANAFGLTNSAKAWLAVVDLPPAISAQPTNQTVILNDTVTFGVVATGFPPLSYQWSFNETNLDGATNTSLTLVNVQTNQAGNYTVLVTNAYGSIFSSNAVLTVNPPSPCVDPPTDLTAWWQAEGSANDSVGTNHGAWINGAGFALGKVGLAFALNGSNYVTIPDSPSLHSLTNRITIEAWVRVNQFSSSPDWNGIVTKGNSSWRLARYGNTSNVGFSTTGLSNTDLRGNRNINDGQWHHVSGVYDGTNKYIYVDGMLDASVPATGTIAQNNYPVCLGENAEATAHRWNGWIDEASIYSRALSADELQAIYNARSNGKCVLPPTILAQPKSQAIIAGDRVTFNVTAAGSQPLGYQWGFNGTSLDGATNSSLILTNTQLDQAGDYAVLVTSAYGAALSSNATLTVTALPPTIQTQPTDQIVLLYNTAVLSAVASGSTPLNYQWRFNGVDLTGATNTSLTLINVKLNQSGNYAVLVTNAYGSILSSNAILTVAPLIIQTQPTNQSVYANEAVIFTVVVSTPVALSYQWTFNGTNLDGATSSSLILPNVQLSQAGTYAVLVTNAYGFALSSNALLTVNPATAPAPCVNPPTGLVAWWQAEGNANDSVGTNHGVWNNGAGFTLGKVGQTFSLNGSNYVAIPDSPSLHAFTNRITIEAWILVSQFNTSPDWNGIVTKGNSSWRLARYGRTSTIAFSTTGLSNGDLGGNKNINDGLWHHVAAVYDGTNKYIYVDGALDASAPATGTITQNNYPVCIGENAEAPAHRWNGWIDEASIYNRALSADELQAIYSARNNGKCPLPPTIFSQPTSQTIVAGRSAAFNVAAVGSQPFTCQWQCNTTNLDGATNAILSLNNVTLDQAGNYSVIVANPAGNVTSSNAILSVYATAAATLNGFWFAGGSGFQFQVAGVPGFNYAVQGSTNLIDWISLLTNTSPFTFVDANATNSPQLFYRAVYLP